MTAPERAKQLKVVDPYPYPRPENYDQAETFLRKECKTVFEWGEESDYVKVTCQAANAEEEKGKTTQEYELMMGWTILERRAKLLEIAQYMWGWKGKQVRGENVS